MSKNVYLDSIIFVRTYLRRLKKETIFFEDKVSIELLDKFIQDLAFIRDLENIDSLGSISTLKKSLSNEQWSIGICNEMATHLLMYLGKTAWAELCSLVAFSIATTYDVDKGSNDDLANLLSKEPWVICIILIRGCDLSDENTNMELNYGSAARPTFVG